MYGVPRMLTLETLNDAVGRELRALPPGMRVRFARTCEPIAALGLERMGAPRLSK